MILQIVQLAALGALIQVAQAQTDLTTQVENDEHEKLLADNFSRTLYVFDVDQGSGSSKCNEDCAEVWPAFMLSSAEAKSLVAPFGFIKRANSKLQLTYHSRPVYTYAFDRKSGDDLGDGIGGVWHYIEL